MSKVPGNQKQDTKRCVEPGEVRAAEVRRCYKKQTKEREVIRGVRGMQVPEMRTNTLQEPVFHRDPVLQPGRETEAVEDYVCAMRSVRWEPRCFGRPDRGPAACQGDIVKTV